MYTYLIIGKQASTNSHIDYASVWVDLSKSSWWTLTPEIKEVVWFSLGHNMLCKYTVNILATYSYRDFRCYLVIQYTSKGV